MTYLYMVQMLKLWLNLKSYICKNQSPKGQNPKDIQG